MKRQRKHYTPEEKLQKPISEDARKEGKLLPSRDPWHAILFYTIVEIIAEVVAKDTPSTSRMRHRKDYGNALGPVMIFEKEWTPWMKGERGFGESVQKVGDAVRGAC